MKYFSRFINYLSRFEIALFCVSIFAILLSSIFIGTENYFVMTASLIGAMALIFLSKGNVVGQILTVVFSVFYGIISYSFTYYGEMLTYLGMTAPIAIASIITWIRNPYIKTKSQVKINTLKGKEVILMFCLSAIVTVAFYFILKALNNANLLLSTISITTSFIASYLSMRRSEFYALAYALNDIVLIVLWIMAFLTSAAYFTMIICFVVFLVNDIYAFINWKKIKKKQTLV